MRPALATLLAGLALSGHARAEDERGRWSFAFGLGVHSTFDDIRNGAAEVISCESVGGCTAPSDGDLSNDRVVVFDPRQDDLLARSTKVEEKQRFDFSLAYGLTSWLSLQVDTGIYEGDVSPLDAFNVASRWVIPEGTTNPKDFIENRDRISQPLTVGSLTQIPLSVSAVVRFRKDSPFNPFMGLGVGYLFNDLEVSPAFNDLNDRILTGFSRVLLRVDSSGQTLMNVQQITQGFVSLENQNTSGGEPGSSAQFLYNTDCTQSTTTRDLSSACSPGDPGFAALPRQPFIVASVDDGFMYQFSLGADYHFNEHWSAFVAARYMVTDASVSVTIQGPGFETSEATFRYLAETNPGTQQGTPNRFIVTSPTIGGGPPPATARNAVLFDTLLVQGGRIDLSAFTVGGGIRFTF